MSLPKPYYSDKHAVIYHGDAREILPESALGFFGAVIMDPPYNFSTTSSGTKFQFWADAVNSAVWFKDILEKCVARLPMMGGVIWQMLNWKTLICLQKAVADSGLEINSLMVWDKMWIGPGGCRGLRPSYELIALILTGEFCLPDRGTPDICQHQWASQKPHGHPSEKPLSLMKQLCILSNAQRILDPFTGSGTVLVAAKELGIKAVGIELEERFCEIAANRLRQSVLDFEPAVRVT